MSCHLSRCLLRDGVRIKLSLRSGMILKLHPSSLPWLHKWALVGLIVIRVSSTPISFIYERGRSICCGGWHIERCKSWWKQRWRGVWKIWLILLLKLLNLIVHKLHVQYHLSCIKLRLHQLKILMMSVKSSNPRVLSKVAHQKTKIILSRRSYCLRTIWISSSIDILIYKTIPTLFKDYIGLFVSELYRCGHKLRVHEI